MTTTTGRSRTDSDPDLLAGLTFTAPVRTHFGGQGRKAIELDPKVVDLASRMLAHNGSKTTGQIAWSNPLVMTNLNITRNLGQSALPKLVKALGIPDAKASYLKVSVSTCDDSPNKRSPKKEDAGNDVKFQFSVRYRTEEEQKEHEESTATRSAAALARV